MAKCQGVQERAVMLITGLTFMLVSPTWAATVTSEDIVDGTIRAVDIHNGNIFPRHFHPSLRTQFQELIDEVAALKARMTTLEGGGTYVQVTGPPAHHPTLQPGDVLTATVECPEGMIVVGGGGYRTIVPEAIGRSIVLRESRAVTPTMWMVQFVHSAETGVGASRDTTAYAFAVCTVGVSSPEEVTP